MLRVTLEIVPFGDERHKKDIGQLIIHNVGCPEREDGQTSCWYRVIETIGKGMPGQYLLPIYHQRDRGAWELVRKAIAEIGVEGP